MRSTAESTFGKDNTSWVDKIGGNRTGGGRDSYIRENSMLREKNKELSLEVDQLKYKIVHYIIERDSMKTKLRRVLGKSAVKRGESSIVVDQHEYINVCRDHETLQDTVDEIRKVCKKLKKQNKLLKDRVQ